MLAARAGIAARAGKNVWKVCWGRIRGERKSVTLGRLVLPHAVHAHGPSVDVEAGPL